VRRVVALTAALALVLVLAACGGGDDGDAVRVFAAASLTDAFTEIAEAFVGEVTLSFAGSATLRAQIESGAPADVFASADERDDGEPFALNTLEIAVPAGNPGGVTGLEDFADDGLLLGVCADEVPCGRYARAGLASAGVDAAIDTSEPDVRSLLTKIEAGELDAGIVYRTDVVASGAAVDGIAIPDDHNVAVTYPIAALTDAGEDFVAFVRSDEGRAILAAHGFETP